MSLVGGMSLAGGLSLVGGAGCESLEWICCFSRFDAPNARPSFKPRTNALKHSLANKIATMSSPPKATSAVTSTNHSGVPAQHSNWSNTFHQQFIWFRSPKSGCGCMLSNVAGRQHRMGIARLDPFFSQALCATLLATPDPSFLDSFDNLREHPDKLDCEQYRSRGHTSYNAHPEYENSTLRTSAPPEELFELMPPAAHLVLNSWNRGC